MNINFEKLYSLANHNINAQNSPKNSPTDGFNIVGNIETPSATENATEGQIEGLKRLQNEADNNAYILERARATYKEYQQNIKQSGQLQTEILKGLQKGEDITLLFLKAVEAISCMTSNRIFYQQAEESLRVIYGLALEQEAPLTLELNQTEERLRKLEQAEQREGEATNRKRLQQAIKEHREKTAEIKALINKERPA